MILNAAQADKLRGNYWQIPLIKIKSYRQEFPAGIESNRDRK
jgi:hypothetical protein|tara:strand:- start:369 stop:494 length:126 start_codon:yes stop_codon:yes gene_type:complete